MTAVLLRLILLFLPLILYLMWRRQVRRRTEAADAGDREALDALQTQFMWIALALVVSFAIVAGILFMTSGEDPSKTYVPPHMEGGKLVPGEFK